MLLDILTILFLFHSLVVEMRTIYNQEACLMITICLVPYLLMMQAQYGLSAKRQEVKN